MLGGCLTVAMALDLVSYSGGSVWCLIKSPCHLITLLCNIIADECTAL